MTRPVAQARIVRVAGMCDQWGVDLTAGCEHRCGYCHFHRYQAMALRHEAGGASVAPALALDELLRRDEYPPELYLSPFTDPLAPAARSNLETLLRCVLPRKVRVAISTKGVVPRRLFRLLALHPEQVILFVGLTSLDDARNRAVEPGCAPAGARLANLALAREYGLPARFVRLDPMLPGVDDAPERLGVVLDAIARSGAVQASAAYLFLTSGTNRARLEGKPYLQDATAQCTEECPIDGGTALSVPLARKRATYEWLNVECARRGLAFGTCGCKDLRLAGSSFPTACSYPHLAECSAASHKGSQARALPVVPS